METEESQAQITRLQQLIADEEQKRLKYRVRLLFITFLNWLMHNNEIFFVKWNFFVVIAFKFCHSFDFLSL